MADEEGTTTESVISAGNDIHFYSDVTDASVCDLVRKLHACKPGPVNLYINSGGGDVYAGITAFTHLMRFQEARNVVITTHAEALVASAATFLLLAGKMRKCSRNSFILIHQVSISCDGTYDSLTREVGNCKMLMERMIRTYAEVTGTRRAVFRRLITQEMHLPPKYARRLNLINA